MEKITSLLSPLQQRLHTSKMAVLGFLKYVILFSLLANCVLTLSVVNVRDHGVVGDGIADDTQVRA